MFGEITNSNRIAEARKKINKGTWSSLVYGARLENEYFTKVVGSNPAVPDNYKYYLYKITIKYYLKSKIKECKVRII